MMEKKRAHPSESSVNSSSAARGSQRQAKRRSMQEDSDSDIALEDVAADGSGAGTHVVSANYIDKMEVTEEVEENMSDEDYVDGMEGVINITSAIEGDDAARLGTPGRGRKVRKLGNEQSPMKLRSRRTPRCWEPKFLLSSSKSKLADCDLKDVLCAAVWESFSESDKEVAIQLVSELDREYIFPDERAVLNTEMFGNSVFKTAAREFQRDLRGGFLEEDYLLRAKFASQQLRERELDSLKDAEFERFWGEKLKPNVNPQPKPDQPPAELQNIAMFKMTTLVKHGMLKVGDNWQFRRSFAKKILVEKDILCAGIDNKHRLTFTYPPDENKFSSDKQPDKITGSIDSPHSLELLLCTEDGRVSTARFKGNGWRTFSIFRNGRKLGSLYELRAQFIGNYFS